MWNMQSIMKGIKYSGHLPLALDRLGAGDNKTSLLRSSFNPLDFYTLYQNYLLIIGEAV